jgi:hypothetical protein
MIRQNDSGGTNTTDWTKWITLPTKLHTSHQLTKRDQWFRFANLTQYGASYLVSIRDNYYNNSPTPVTWIINVGHESATITQVGRAVLSPTSLTKLRIVRYSNNSAYGFHLEVYTPYQSTISQNTPEINIMNLGRDNMSDGIELVHAINDDTKWLEVNKTIQSGELLIQEVGISDTTTLWGQPFDGTSNVSGSLIGVTSIEMNSDGALSGYGGFIDFHYSGSSADYTSRIIEDASGRVSINSVLFAQYGGNVGIGTTPSSSHKLYVSGTFHASGNSSIGGTLSVSGTSTLTGHVGIGTTPHNTYVLRADGEVYVSTGLYSHGYVTALSDIRHKDVMGDVKLTVSEVANAPAVKFMWKDRRQEGLQVGSIAQYWQKVLPEAIVEAADGELTMSYGVIALLASIANAREIVNLKREIAELKRTLSNHGILE